MCRASDCRYQTWQGRSLARTAEATELQLAWRRQETSWRMMTPLVWRPPLLSAVIAASAVVLAASPALVGRVAPRVGRTALLPVLTWVSRPALALAWWPRLPWAWRLPSPATCLTNGVQQVACSGEA